MKELNRIWLNDKIYMKNKYYISSRKTSRGYTLAYINLQLVFQNVTVCMIMKKLQRKKNISFAFLIRFDIYEQEDITIGLLLSFGKTGQLKEK